MGADNLTRQIERYKDIAWFSQAGTPHNEYFVINDAVEPFDKPELRMVELWDSNTHALEVQARTAISDSDIDNKRGRRD